ncbi:peptidase associated/transthyretin-like domain-containing protein [Archangium lipolyticum]|uniref:hypothetical protein n=1 Tax=Archangium lipolyticum TaxID=2970465 RepID=UPI002149CB1E|nr:hypothetical protein [Archangium lipolyticum]
MRNGAALGLALMVLMHSPWTASAATPNKPGTRPETEATLPWSRNVPQEDQDAAYVLFREANGLLKESFFRQASEKYTQALERWKHPAIHYNLALALMNLDKPVEAHQHLESAMRYGPEPLEEEKYEYARTYKALIEKQLTRVEFSCDTPGAIVTLDGQPLFTAPGHYVGMVRPGAHSLVATKEGYLPTDMSRTFMPGEQLTLDLKMCTVEECTVYKRRWPVWMPWAVVGSGMAVAAGGGLLQLQTSQSYDTFDAGIRECGGCSMRDKPDLAALRTRGDNLQRAAFGAYGIGGAALVTGAVLLILNQPQAHRTDPNKPNHAVDVTPLLGGDTNGVLATFRF